MLFTDAAEQHARYNRLQQRLERIDERLAALELRCSRSVAATGHADSPATGRIEQSREIA